MSKAKALLEKLEWSGKRRGPGSMMGRDDGDLYSSCPVCGGLKAPNADFEMIAVGHRPNCELVDALHEEPAHV